MNKHRLLVTRSLTVVIGLTVLWTGTVTSARADDRHERGRMEDIMDVVAKDIQKRFYDPHLKGVDWQAITERARQRIRQADHIGDMLAAIASVPYQLNDSHTVFIPPGRSAKVEYGFEAEPFAKDIFVYELKKDGPAIRAGLQLGDKIISLDGFATDRGNFFEMIRYFEFLNPTTEMTLEVVRGNDPPQTITIHAKVGQHGNIFTDAYNEYWQAVDAEEPVYKHHDYEGNIGYLKLREFTLSRRNADAMLSRVKNSSAVIIDLRGNGGGALETLTAIAGSFTDHPHEMAKEIGRVKTHTLMIKPETPRITAPVFVMVDSKSASASEMFARDLQIGKRAIIIGDHSSGRVNAAEFFLEKVGAFDLVAFGTEIAVSKVVMADGEELENRGVNPDEFCIPTAKDLHDKKDPCLDRTLELARAASNRAAQPQP